MGLLDDLAAQQQSNNPQAQSPAQPRALPEIPQPIQDVRTDPMGGPRNQAELDAMTVRSNAPQGGSVLDQLAEADKQKQLQAAKTGATTDTTTTDGLATRLGKRVYGDMMTGFGIMGDQIGKMVPQAATGPLAFATHKVIEPYNESMAWASKTAGELAEKAATFGTPYTVEQ